MRILLRVAYDGTEYFGYQIQPKGRTIQACLEAAASDLFGCPVHMTGGSRTDSGVHSYGNPVVFDIDTRMRPESIAPALNTRLPDDITVMSSDAVADDFSPHAIPSRKTYEYRIVCARYVYPTEKRYIYHMHIDLDTERMRRAGEYLVGEHDFTSFSSPKAQVTSRVRTVYSLNVSEKTIISDKGDMSLPDGARRYITIRVTGNGFLYNMVRIISGTLIDAGRGRIAPSSVPEILAGKDRRLAGPTVPPQGLFLMGTKFERKQE